MPKAKKTWKFAGGWSYITPSGKRAWSKTKPDVGGAKSANRKTNKRKTSKSTSKRRRISMPRRSRKRRSKKFKVPLATAFGLAAGFVGPMGDSPFEYAQKGDFRSMLVRLGKSYTGYDANSGKWEPHLMASGLVPLVIGGLVSKFVGGKPLNLNRKLADIPFIKI